MEAFQFNKCAGQIICLNYSEWAWGMVMCVCLGRVMFTWILDADVHVSAAPFAARSVIVFFHLLNFSISAIFCFVYFLLASIVSYLIGSARGCLFIWNSNLWILWLSPIKLFTLLLSLDMSLLSSVGVPNLVVWKLCTLPQGFWGVTGARDSVHFGHWCTLLSMSKEWSNLPAKSYRDGWEKTVPLHGMCLISCLLALNHESQKFATGLLWSLVDRP